MVLCPQTGMGDRTAPSCEKHYNNYNARLSEHEAAYLPSFLILSSFLIGINPFAHFWNLPVPVILYHLDPASSAFFFHHICLPPYLVCRASLEEKFRNPLLALRNACLSRLAVWSKVPLTYSPCIW